MRNLLRFSAAVLLLCVTFAIGWAVGTFRIGSAVSREQLSDLERQFADRMKGAALVGRFTVAGREDRQPSPDRYEIGSVEKVGRDQWRFNARVKYADVDLTVPVVVPLQWAGDTPVITMTDVAVPSMGTFTVRILFYGDRYSGTWQHGQTGGHMFGRIEKSAS